ALRSAPPFDLAAKAYARAKAGTMARLAGDRPAASRVMRRMKRAFRLGRGRARRISHNRRRPPTRRAAAVGHRQTKPRQPLDRAQEVALLVVAKRDRLAPIARARGAADPMDVGF